MKKFRFGSAAIFLLLGAGLANAGDSAKDPPPLPVQYDWSGFYGGITAGGAWGQYDAKTSTVGGTFLDALQAAAVDAAGAQRVKPTGFATGIEGGYNWQTGDLLLGVEADLQALHLNGATNSGAAAYPGAPTSFFTVTSYGNSDWLFTARPRIGFVAPNHWLFYATGGLALTRLQSDFSFIDTGGAAESAKVGAVKAGYAVGGGIEVPLTDRLRVKAEYLYVDFANTAGTVTATNLPADQVFTHSSSLTADIVRAGLNYRFGGPDAPPTSGTIMPLKAPVWKAAPSLDPDWEVETGIRLWFSGGRDGEGPLLNGPPITLASRLIYGGLDALSGETYARADHASGFFVKGYLGAGGTTDGHFNDEDFPGNRVYSDTLASASGHIGYATIDLGYNFLTAPGAKVGAFVGYNYYAQAINTYGCAQLAGDTVCTPAVQSNLLGLTENDRFNSMRVGLSSEVMLTDRLRLGADAAYVPWVTYAGLDDHLLRQLLGPDAANSGNGVMLEATLDYAITNAWNVGVGGRYWAWNMNTGTAGFNFLTTPASNAVVPSRYSTERRRPDRRQLADRPVGLGRASRCRCGEPARREHLRLRPRRHQLPACRQFARYHHRPPRLCLGPLACLREGRRRLDRYHLRSVGRHKCSRSRHRRHDPRYMGLDARRRHRIRAHRPLDRAGRIRPYRPALDDRCVPDRRRDQRAEHQRQADSRPLQTRCELQIRPRLAARNRGEELTGGRLRSRGQSHSRARSGARSARRRTGPRSARPPHADKEAVDHCRRSSLVGGLPVSQFLTLYTTPIIYLYLDRLSHWLGRRTASAPGAAAGRRAARRARRSEVVIARSKATKRSISLRPAGTLSARERETGLLRFARNDDSVTAG